MLNNQIKPIALMVLLILSLKISLFAQDTKSVKFLDGNQLTLLGRNIKLPLNGYYRIDSADLSKIPRRVATLSSNSAGMSVSFQTDSKSISIKWTLLKFNTLANMTPIAINGLDLYGWNGNYWQYVASAKPKGLENEALVINHLDGKLRSYRFYLPLYAGVKDLQIGVEKSAVIQKEPSDFVPEKKVVIYGSSITQGTSASRPGMAYPSIVGRKLNIETFNMGFSGSGKMELPLADIIAKMDADVYILDCVPNPSPKGDS